MPSLRYSRPVRAEVTDSVGCQKSAVQTSSTGRPMHIQCSCPFNGTPCRISSQPSRPRDLLKPGKQPLLATCRSRDPLKPGKKPLLATSRSRDLLKPGKQKLLATSRQRHRPVGGAVSTGWDSCRNHRSTLQPVLLRRVIAEESFAVSQLQLDFQSCLNTFLPCEWKL